MANQNRRNGALSPPLSRRFLRRPPRALLVALSVLFSIPAYGHGVGLRYDLPLPLALWIGGAASTVLLSFLIVAIAVRSNASVAAPVQFDLARRQLGNSVPRGTIRFIVQLLAVGALVLVVVAGIIGDQIPTRNLAPTAIWIAWWVGFSYVSAFVGNIWSVVNPWAAIFDWCEHLRSKATVPRTAKVNWPGWLGAWPATALFLVFAWLELIWEGRSIPLRLAWLAIAFSVLTWTGMFLFGRRTWLTHADPFALAFGILARFGPTEIRVERTVCDACAADGRTGTDRREVLNCDACDRATESRGRWLLRPPGAGLLHTEDISYSLVVFVIVMLSTVTFDGVMATPVWQHIENALYGALPALGDARLAIINTLGLLAFCGVFVAVYRLVATWIACYSEDRMTPDTASRAFVLTLVPIAIAYLIAHYLSYFLIQGQLLIRLASDPFGFGWDVFGTARFRPDIGIVGARFVWYTSLIAIVIGHVAAVSLAHIVALRHLGDPRLAIRSQIPMLVLMIAYTMLSLWIIAQPIVE
jgi:hypothetical protein